MRLLMLSNSEKIAISGNDALINDLRRHQKQLQLQNKELRRSQHELTRSRLQYKDLFDQAPTCYITLCESGHILNLNQEAKTTFHRQDLAGQPMVSLIAPDDHQKFISHFQATLTSKTRQVFDVQLGLNSHYKIRIYRFTTTAYNQLSPTNEAVLLSATDVTERFIAASRVRAIIDCSPDAMITFCENGEIVDANFQAEQLLYASKNNLKGLSTAKFINEKFRRKYGKKLRQRILRDTSDGKISSYKLNLVDAEGRCFPAIAKISSIDSTLENLYVASIRDITKERNAIKTAFRTRTAALKASRTKSNFLANMSHELRTPITSIMGFADLLVDEIATREPRRYLESIRKNSQHLKQVINDILDISSIESGKLKIKKKSCNFFDLISETSESLKVALNEKGLFFRLTIDDNVPKNIVLDPVRVKQILLNLIGNAIKFTDKGWVSVNISRQSTDEHSILKVEVKDTGCGIAEEHVGNLFNMFYQADAGNNRRHGGTGLGLAVSKNLAALMEGDVNLEATEPNKGSEFVFSLKIPGTPLAKSKKSIAGAQAQQKSTDTMTLKGLRVLVVEDGEDIQLLLKSYLRKAGATVDQALNGLEGYEKAMTGQYDVVLMDIQMPIVDGLEATGMLRNQKYRGPIIAVSANAFPSDVSLSLKSGCNDHLSKPIQYDKLVAKVKHWSTEYLNNIS